MSDHHYRSCHRQLYLAGPGCPHSLMTNGQVTFSTDLKALTSGAICLNPQSGAVTRSGYGFCG